MAQAFSYKKTQNTKLKAVGTLDVDNMFVYIDDEPKSLKSLLKDFNGAVVDLQVNVKSEEDLDMPTAE